MSISNSKFAKANFYIEVNTIIPGQLDSFESTRWRCGTILGQKGKKNTNSQYLKSPASHLQIPRPPYMMCWAFTRLCHSATSSIAVSQRGKEGVLFKKKKIFAVRLRLWESLRGEALKSISPGMYPSCPCIFALCNAETRFMTLPRYHALQNFLRLSIQAGFQLCLKIDFTYAQKKSASG